MRFAISWVVRDLGGYPELVRRCEAAGFEAIGVPDTAAPAYRDLHVAMTAAVQATRSAQVISMVTNPDGREAQATANAMSSLQELSGGRVACGLGSAQTAAAGFGRWPGTRRRLAEYVAELRAAFSWLGAINHRPACPVYLAAEGPRMTELAGAIGDGVLLAGDLRPERIPWYLDRLAAGAATAGRALPAGFAMWGLLRVSVADTGREALEAAAPALAAAANHAYRAGFDGSGLEPAQQDAVRTLRAGYQVCHLSDFRGGNVNGAAVRRLGLAPALAGRFGLVGDPAGCAARLRTLEAAGLAGVVVRPVTTDPHGFLDRWARIRDAYERSG